VPADDRAAALKGDTPAARSARRQLFRGLPCGRRARRVQAGRGSFRVKI